MKKFSPKIFSTLGDLSSSNIKFVVLRVLYRYIILCCCLILMFMDSKFRMRGTQVVESLTANISFSEEGTINR